MALVRFRTTRRRDQPRQQANSSFDFDRLPDYLFIRILDQLEFRQRFNIARVNHRFKDMCDYSVSMIKSFDSNVGLPNADLLREMVGMFARSLRVASLRSRTCTAERFDAISNFEYPRLASIEIDGWINQVPIFLANCPNLRRLKIRNSDNATIDLGQSVFPQVESVDFETCSSSTIERVLDACPNVNNFSMYLSVDETGQFIGRLDQFFAARVNSMESIDMNFRHGYSSLLLRKFDNLWRLRSLRVLKIDPDEMTVDDMSKISNSFPNLQILRLKTLRLNGGCISTLSTLKNLTDLKLSPRDYMRDVDIREFVMTSEAEGLRRFKITRAFSLPMVMDIIERFPRLKNLIVRQVLNFDSMYSAISTPAQVRRKCAQRGLKIDLKLSMMYGSSRSRRVRRAIKKIRRAASAMKNNYGGGWKWEVQEKDREEDRTNLSSNFLLKYDI